MIIEDADLVRVARWLDPDRFEGILFDLDYTRARGGLVLEAHIGSVVLGYAQAYAYGPSAHVFHVRVSKPRSGIATALYDVIVDSTSCSELTASVHSENIPAVSFHNAYRRTRTGSTERFSGGSWRCSFT